MNSFEKPQVEKGEITPDETEKQKAAENELEDNNERLSHSIDGVMVTGKEYQDYLERGRDAQ